MRKTSFGFTMIEILVVVAVIGILSTIGVVAFIKVQTDSRDSQRSTRVTVISEALEKYYQKNGEYPSCAQMQQDPTTIKNSVLKGVDASVFVTPTDKTNNNSITTCTNLTAGPGSDVFAYVGDGSPDCLSGDSCLSYSLKYREEATGDIVSVDSRHSADIATSGAPVVTANPTSFSRIELSWSAVQNAASYSIERHSNASSCSTGTSTSKSSSTNSYNDTGLTSGTEYYYQVKALDSNGLSGNWSNCISSTTLALSGIQLIATSASNSQIDLQWNRDSSATTYDIDYSTDSNFGSSTPIHNIPQESGSTLSRSVTGLTTGVQYYFRGQSVSGGVHGPWSYDNATTYVPAPASTTATTNSATQITADWSNVSVATSYTLEYSTTETFTPSTTDSISGITGLSQAASNLQQGTKYYFRVFALVNTTPSVASPSADSITTVNKPGAPGVSASQPGAIRTCAAGAWIKSPLYCPNNYYASGRITSASCPSGTSPRYQLSARYNSPTTKYYTSTTTTSRWYMSAASGGYYTLWAGRYYCNGPDANSSWGPWSSERRT